MLNSILYIVPFTVQLITCNRGKSTITHNKQLPLNISTNINF